MSMESIKWEELTVIESLCKEKTFLKALEIWLLKPQVVNRRLAGAVVLHTSYTDTCSDVEQAIDKLSAISYSGDNFCDKVFSSQNETNADSSREKVRNSESEILQEIGGSDGDEKEKFENNDSQFEFCVRKLLPRQTRQGGTEATSNEIIIIDRKECIATFVPVLNGDKSSEVDSCHRHGFHTAYQISLSSSRISLHISENYEEPKSPSLAVACPTRAWLKDSLLPKIAKWASVVSADAPVKSSQALVSMERYSTLYGQLRKKYGAKFVKTWPEKTDPLKFVYEDVAIATYLLVLWEQERAQMGLEARQSFVDLGCGNGLLVHILNSEGHPGKGIDLRRRKIWDLYGEGTNLEERSITPSDDFLYADYDWLIGNHSDELTPWIPVMAARSSYTTRYFVLPCCFHDFDVKFVRGQQTKTQYRSYLDFIEDIGRVSGFMVQEDTMRIPSTKRVCQIGGQRTHPLEQMEEVHENISKYVASRLSKAHNKTTPKRQQNTSKCIPGEKDPGTGSPPHHQQPDSDSSPTQRSSAKSVDPSPREAEESRGSTKVSSLSTRWAPDFRPRDRIEPVRNCHRVDYDLKQRITKDVADAILEKEGSNSSDSMRGAKEQKIWRRGGCLTLSEVAKLFDRDTLKQLKSECGGLKTLLKNFNQVFQVSTDKVEIRDWCLTPPSQPTQSKKSRHDPNLLKLCFKTRLCWFDVHHPDGCPRLAIECQFAHGADELRRFTLPSM